MVKRRFLDIIVASLICLSAAAVVFPVIFVAASSLRSGFNAYIDFYIWEPRYLYALTNSIIISAAAAVGATSVSVFAAYVFAKVRFRGRDFIFYFYIIVMMMPFQVTLLPQYIISKTFSIYDTPLALILPGVFSPFTVFLLTQIMKSMPDDMIEAARLDTSSTLVIVTRIIIPAIKPGIICAFVLAFAEQWNAVAEPLVLMETHEKFPLAVFLNQVSANDALALTAVALFAVIPFLLFSLFEAQVIEGLGEYRLK